MHTKRFLKIILILILFSIIFVGSNVFGIFSEADTYTKMKVFTEILNFIKDDYVDEKSSAKLVDSAISGMLKELDPHSTLLPPERSRRMDERFQGFGGIGIIFRIIDEKITINDVFSGGPCDKLGLMRGDKIVEIGSESAIGIDQDGGFIIYIYWICN